MTAVATTGRARELVVPAPVTGPDGRSPSVDRILMTGLAAAQEPIGLAEVAEGASLQTRVDKKYLVPTQVLASVVRQLGLSLKVLDIDGRRVFGYESVYFDTDDLDFYRDHVMGRRQRNKVRTRLYVDSGLTMLEVKAKGGRGETVKHRMDWDRESLDRIRTSKKELDGEGFVDAYLSGRHQATSLRPSLLSRYRRTTFVDVEAGLRLTCDIDLSFGGLGKAVVVPPGRVLVETKSESGRSTADRLLHRYGQRDLAVSKYCVGVAMTSGRPANRWHRTVKRYLAA